MPLPVVPSAQAEIVDDVINQAFSPFMDEATNSIEWDALFTPAAWEAFFDPAHWDSVFAGLGFEAGVGGAAEASAADLTASFERFIYSPIHTGIENWIHSDLGQQVDSVINQLAGSYVIGDGTTGTEAHPDGGDAGWLFGDGGAGWNNITADASGGGGGNAGIFGNGGAGGDGGPAGSDVAGGNGGAGGSLMGIGGAGGAGGAGDPGGAGGDAPGWLFGIGGTGGDGGAGDHGGDGGNGTGLFGSGGHGGNGGDGDNLAGMPALGGAGGHGGLLGSHGAVGHYGTLPGGPSSTEGLVSTTGSWLTDSDGRVLVLHGLNQVYKLPPFEPSAVGFSDDDAAFLAAHGFNAVRVGLIWAGVEPEPGVFDTAYLASIEKTVQTLADHGIVSILDMHEDGYSSVFGGEGAPAWATETGGLPPPEPDSGQTLTGVIGSLSAWKAFWSNAEAPDGVGLENHYAQMYEHVANYFSGNPDVAGYEIMNEPWPVSPPTLFGSPDFGVQELTPFYNQVASAIRAVDPTTPIFFEPDISAGFGAPVDLGTVDQPHTVFAFHDYCLQAQFTGGSFTFGCVPFLDAVADHAEAYAEAHGIPAFLTEFGSSGNLALLTDTMQSADQHRVGWLEWEYTDRGDITTTGNGEGWLVKDPDQPPVGDNVDTAKLATLAAPYPQAVAGTPESWSFDPKTDTFNLSYSTERADGSGDFAAGSQTTVSVPAIEYPNGYQVSVTGGHVISDPNAPVLIVGSDNGATTVNVTVTAAGSVPGSP